MRFVDTNVALYAVSSQTKEATKRRISLDVLSQEPRNLAISAQVLGEFYSQVTRPSRIDPLLHEEAVEVIEDLKRFYVQPLTLQTVDQALEYRQKFGLNYWDCLILATARQSGCDAVYSEDMSSGQDYDGISVINPFDEAGDPALA